MNLKNVLVCTLLGTTIMFVWGATEWFNPLLHKPYKKPSNPKIVNKLLNENLLESGMYIWPNGNETKTSEGNAKDIVYFIAKNDASFYNPSKFMFVELLTQLLIWFIVSYLLFITNFQSHWKRVKFILALGILGALTYYLPLWNWWGFSTEYVIIRTANILVGWFIAGLAISYLFRNKFTNKNI